MRRRPLTVRNTALLLALLAVPLRPGLAAAPVGGTEPAPPRITGSVKKPGALDAAALSGLPRQAILVKWPGSAGAFRGTFEVEGVPLKALLERSEIAKAVDDGFARPLDLSVVVVGRDGRKALYSWGELFLGGDGGAALVVDRLRPLVPEHHAPLADPAWKGSPWIPAASRAATSVASCSGCHDGTQRPKIDLPRGLCVVPARDRTGRRIVEDVVEIQVRQAGFAAPPRPDKGFDPWVSEPSLVLPGGRTEKIAGDALKALPRSEWEEDAVGLGRGFRGRQRLAGASLTALLEARLPAGTDPGTLAVVVTASDGYRALYSGGELLLSRLPGNAVLVDTEDGQPLLRKSGRYKAVLRGDFFVDRSVRSVAEIRCVTKP